MKALRNKTNRREWRHNRVRAKISGTPERLRLSVFRSNRHFYAQLIDDVAGKTVVAANDSEVKPEAKSEFAKVATATAVGKLLAERAKEKKITKVVFDRSGYRYTGRVKAVADGARAGGLEF